MKCLVKRSLAPSRVRCDDSLTHPLHYQRKQSEIGEAGCNTQPLATDVKDGIAEQVRQYSTDEDVGHERSELLAVCHHFGPHSFAPARACLNC